MWRTEERAVSGVYFCGCVTNWILSSRKERLRGVGSMSITINRGITLTDGFFVEIDPLNVTLKRKYTYYNKKTDTEKETVKTLGYYSTLEEVLMAFVKERQKLYLSDLTTNLDEYLRMVDESNKAAVSQLRAILEGNG